MEDGTYKLAVIKDTSDYDFFNVRIENSSTIFYLTGFISNETL